MSDYRLGVRDCSDRDPEVHRYSAHAAVLTMGSVAEKDPIEPPPLSTRCRERTDAPVEHREVRTLTLGSPKLSRCEAHRPGRVQSLGSFIGHVSRPASSGYPLHDPRPSGRRSAGALSRA
jgi:hypothetical protein